MPPHRLGSGIASLLIRMTKLGNRDFEFSIRRGSLAGIGPAATVARRRRSSTALRPNHSPDRNRHHRVLKLSRHEAAREQRAQFRRKNKECFRAIVVKRFDAERIAGQHQLLFRPRPRSRVQTCRANGEMHSRPSADKHAARLPYRKAMTTRPDRCRSHCGVALKL